MSSFFPKIQGWWSIKIIDRLENDLLPSGRNCGKVKISLQQVSFKNGLNPYDGYTEWGEIYYKKLSVYSYENFATTTEETGAYCIIQGNKVFTECEQTFAYF